jgi:hypothetical protein
MNLGSNRRAEMTATVTNAVKSAGLVTTVALVLSGVALIVAAVALIVAVRRG